MAQSEDQSAPRKTNNYKKFSGMASQNERYNVKDDEMFWLENIMRTGPRKLRSVPGPTPILATFPPTPPRCPDTTDFILPQDIGVIKSFGLNEGLPPKVAPDPFSPVGAVTTYFDPGNNQASWAQIGANDEIYALVYGLTKTGAYNFYAKQYPDNCVLVHFKADGSREVLNPLHRAAAAGTPYISAGLSAVIGSGDQPGYCIQGHYFSIPEGDGGEHYFPNAGTGNDVSFTTFLKAGNNFYTAGTSNISGIPRTVRRFDYPSSTWAGATKLAESVPLLSQACASLKIFGTRIFALSPSPNLLHVTVLDSTSLAIIETIDIPISSLVTPTGISVISNDKFYILNNIGSGAGDVTTNLLMWTRTGGVSFVTSHNISIDPAHNTINWFGTFIGSQGFTFQNGFFYTGANGCCNGYAIDIVKIGPLACPP